MVGPGIGCRHCLGVNGYGVWVGKAMIWIPELGYGIGHDLGHGHHKQGPGIHIGVIMSIHSLFPSFSHKIDHSLLRRLTVNTSLTRLLFSHLCVGQSSVTVYYYCLIMNSPLCEGRFPLTFDITKLASVRMYVRAHKQCERNPASKAHVLMVKTSVSWLARSSNPTEMGDVLTNI